METWRLETREWYLLGLLGLLRGLEGFDIAGGFVVNALGKG